MYPIYNNYFKPPRRQSTLPERSPSPPTAYVEPLSPAAFRPFPIEPSFNYPPVQYQQRTSSYGAHESEDRAHNANGKRRHQRIPSNIDTLADAALAARSSDAVSSYERYGGQPELKSEHVSEPPHKRARSYQFSHAIQPSSYDRPATSHYGWAIQSQTDHTYDARVEDAALLLNFSSAASYIAPQPQPNYQYAQHEYVHNQAEYRGGLLPAFNPAPRYSYAQPHVLPSPQRTSDGGDPSSEIVSEQSINFNNTLPYPAPQQTQTPPEDKDVDVKHEIAAAPAVPRGRKKTKEPKPRQKPGPKKSIEKAPKRATTARKRKSTAKNQSIEPVEPEVRRRRLSTGDWQKSQHQRDTSRAASVPVDINMILRPLPAGAKPRRARKTKTETICGACHAQRHSAAGSQLDEWVSCNGCKQWFHLDCAGFKKAHEVRDVDKFFCKTCEPTHGKTTYVRKSKRAHTSVDYAELQKGVLKTSEESNEHHYIQPIKDGTFTFDPETFPRMRPELLTREFFEKSGAFVEPICIPAEWNKRPWGRPSTSTEEGSHETLAEEALAEEVAAMNFEYDCLADEGQDALDMVMPKNLTVRKVCNLVGPETPLDVIDVKTQNSGAKWNLARWADYYEADGEDKEIRNVISLEVSQTKLGRLLRRPKVVRDIDLQDDVWPQDERDKGKFPKVQYYCLMSIADSYTDFHIDFGGSSVYYHLLKGKKTFFFIPPKPKHLKAYEEWNNNPQQNFTYLPHITKECYRVDLFEGDTMLIPSGWIHAVWTPETSLVIGGNFLNRMSFKNQFRVVEIEKNNNTPQKFRYPGFQKLMWYTIIKYMRDDPIPEQVVQNFLAGGQFNRERPIWQDYDEEHDARYYGQAEVDGLPELASFIIRTYMMANGLMEGITADRQRRINASVPKNHGDPLELAKRFGLWVAWKRGNEDPPAWAHPDANLAKVEPKKLSVAKAVDKRAAFTTTAADRKTKRSRKENSAVPDLSAAQTDGPVDATMHEEASTLQNAELVDHATFSIHQSFPSNHASHMLYPQPSHQEDTVMMSYDFQAANSMPPQSIMMQAFQGQHISTPKTSVLGPKRVACDACRRRRIRCKHKEFVIEASADLPFHQLSDGFQAIGASGDENGIAYEQADINEYDDTYNDSVNGLTNGLRHNFEVKNENAPHTPNGSAGSPTVFDSRVPMTFNGVNLFGTEQKKGRSKACVECRKSKRRCIHDEHGNVDPIKAAEIPIPRASPSTKKRLSDDELPGTKKIKTEKPVSAQHGVRGVLKPINNFDQNQAIIAIDPELMSAYSRSTDSPFESDYPYVPVDRPALVTLPSLEQIATEVLDMNGGEQANVNGLAQSRANGEAIINTQQAESEEDSLTSTDKGATSKPTDNTESSRDSHQRRDSVSNLPLYKPPASKSPELRRAVAELPNNPAHEERAPEKLASCL